LQPGFLSDLHEILPAEYVKVKGIDKRVYDAHKKLAGQPELHLKLKFALLASVVFSHALF
jgi:hypothetical protein